MKGKKTSPAERINKLETSKAERQKIFKDLCNHVAQGFSVLSFAKVHPQTIDRWFESFPDDFVRADYDSALVEGRHWWEQVGRKQANGECLGNSRTWFYNMVNRYGWREKIDIEAEHKGNLNVNVVSYATKKHLKDSSE